MDWKRFLVLAMVTASYSLLLSGCQAGINSNGLRAFDAGIIPAHRINSEQVIRKVRIINAPRSLVWNVLADYENVHQFVDSIKDSELVGGPAQGVGAVRQCTVALGMKVTEDVAAWDHGNRMVVNMHSAIPVANHVADFRLQDAEHGQTKVVFVMKYNTKAGMVGKAMNAAFLEASMEQSMNDLLDGLEHFIATGQANRYQQ